jgi:predicted dehydrogenase
MTIQVALIGAGGMGKVHSDAYQEIGDARVVAVVDVDMARSRKLVKVHDARTYLSNEIEYFVRCIRTNTPPAVSTLDQFYAVMETLDAEL